MHGVTNDIPHYGLETTNWSGLIAAGPGIEGGGPTITGVEGDWVVPTVPATADDEYSGTWVGLDGVTDTSLIQAGTLQDSGDGTTTYGAWYEILPASPVAIDEPVSPGDSMDAVIAQVAAPDTYVVIVTDLTEGWRWQSEPNVVYTGPGDTAEWIEEAPTVDGAQSTLARFGTVNFTSIQLYSDSPGGSYPLIPVSMANPNGVVIAYPGTYDGTGFSDTYGTPPPDIEAMSPSEGSTSGGTQVTIDGDYLTGATSVSFGGTSVPFSTNPDSSITATAPPEPAGTVAVTVTTLGGTSSITGVTQFTYVGPPPSSAPPPPTSPSSSAATIPAPITGMASTPTGNGYWIVDAEGAVLARGAAINYGSMSGHALAAPISYIVSTPSGNGYWLVAADGGMFSFGDANFYGSMGGHHLDAPVVDVAPTSDGGGYWLVASDGGIFAFGDARFQGSMGGRHLNAPVVGITPDYATGGYWEVATDGGIFAFGAPFFGSTGNVHLVKPVNGMTATPDGQGYYFVAADGGIFAYGSTHFYGSMAGRHLDAPIVGMATCHGTGGYWLVASDGGIFSFNAPFYGSD